MGIALLFLEEPRRALVAMEMMYSGDYIHTTIHGAAYYNKPPLFNWLVVAGWFAYFHYTESRKYWTGYLVFTCVWLYAF